MTVIIRNANPDDQIAVFPLVREFATSFPVDHARFTLGFAQVLASPNMYLTVAQKGDVIIGYLLGTIHATLYAGGNVAWVEEIMVHQDYRRTGVGEHLMDDFERWAASNECRLVGLATRRASEFYKSLGYEDSATYFRKVIGD